MAAFVIGNGLLSALGQQPISVSLGGHVPPDDAPHNGGASVYVNVNVMYPEPEKPAIVSEIEQLGGATGIGGSAPASKAAAFTEAISEASTEVPGIGDVGGKEDDALAEPPAPAYASDTARCDATAPVEAEAVGASP